MMRNNAVLDKFRLYIIPLKTKMSFVESGTRGCVG